MEFFIFTFGLLGLFGIIFSIISFFEILADRDREVSTIILVFSLIVAGLCGLGLSSSKISYNQGQIDQASGKNTVILVENSDKTTSWKPASSTQPEK